jgi:putative membrane-bound dehydrogenase-like protein
MVRSNRFALVLLAIVFVTRGLQAQGEDLAYLSRNDIYYPNHEFPKLTTPQWVGEKGVEAVVILAIDDMRDPAKYEQYLRPILQRLKKIDGRAPVSIMTCSVKPDDQQLQSWLDEGLSIECHSVDHPCPLLNGGDFDKAKSTYDRCVDAISQIKGNKPVAFRMPCCDSLNTVSPRFYSDIFNKTTKDGRYLQISTSVFQAFTSKDRSIPRDLVLDEKGNERFTRYMPSGFENWIENYPYPYVINNLCWEFPCMVPSDWEAQHIQQPNNPKTVDDMKRALDITVVKQGVFPLVFHPHGWIKNSQVIELIDHAVTKHGQKVKFLTFKEANQLLIDNLLHGNPLRDSKGGDNGVRLVDVDQDGYLDVVIGNEKEKRTRIWKKLPARWEESGLPFALRPLVLSRDAKNDKTKQTPDPLIDRTELAVPPVQIIRTPDQGSLKLVDLGGLTDSNRPNVKPQAFYFDSEDWVADRTIQLLFDEHLKKQSDKGLLLAVKFARVSKHGSSLTFITRESPADEQPITEVFTWNTKPGVWQKIRAQVPREVATAFAKPGSQSVRLEDIDQDGSADILLSTKNGLRIWRMNWYSSGAATEYHQQEVLKDAPDLWPLMREDGTDNGFFVHGDSLCWQNEDTSKLPDLIHRVRFKELKDTQAKADKKLRGMRPILIGAAKRNITPDYPVRLAGYASRKNEVTEVAQPIFASALAMGGSEQHVADKEALRLIRLARGKRVRFHTPPLTVLVSVDNCGVPASVVDKVFAEVTKRFKIPRERFVVSSTHTHSAPWLRDCAPLLTGDVPADHAKHLEQYEADLVQALVEVSASAIAKRQTATLWTGVGKVGFAKNRRKLGLGKKWVGFGEQEDGPVDRRLHVLVARGIDDHVISVVANYACHCTTTGFDSISGDWAGYARKYIEEAFPGTVPLISIGTGADANPSPRGTEEMSIAHGFELATEVKRLLTERRALMLIDPKAECRTDTVQLPHDKLPTVEYWQEELKAGGQRALRAQLFLDKIKNKEEIPTTVPYPITTWVFGNDLSMVFLSGEVVVDYGIRLNDLLDGDRLWVSSYCNAIPCYIASKRVLREGGYEADSSMIYFARPTRLAPEAEDIIVDTVQRLLPPRFYSKTTRLDFPPPIRWPEIQQTLDEVFHVPKGFKIELVANEPMVRDPIAFDWDEHGQLWVLQMGDYPNGIDGKPAGEIWVLRDTSGDGRYDNSAQFMRGIPFPTGIQCWRDGVLVTAAPDIFFAADRNNDWQADFKKVLYRGFGEGNQQHRVNGLRLGLDNWLHVGNGDSGGDIKSLAGVLDLDELSKKPSRFALGIGESSSVNGRDLRIRPDLGIFETQSGQTQFGRARDDWGNWFGCNNSNPMWHYLLSESYLRRNPNFAFGDTRNHVFQVPGASPVFPRSRTLARYNDFDRLNRFTSACSTMIFRDSYLGDDIYGNSFTSEPVHNLVSRRVISAHGSSFQGSRADSEKKSEFLASTDNWFRPTMVRTGPDGALWIADMYRFVIEHPKWIPADWQRRLDLRAGSDMGRIYRIVPEGNTRSAVHYLARTKDADPLTSAMLVAQLEESNGWRRDIAQRILVHRQDRTVIPALVDLLSNHKQPVTRLHALCTLDGLRALSEKELLQALGDAHSGVRRHAIRLSEAELMAKNSKITTAIVELLKDSDPQLQIQLAYSIGHSPDSRAATVLAALLSRAADDRSLRGAVISSLTENNIDDVLRESLKTDALTTGNNQAALLIGQAAAFKRVDIVLAQFKTVFESNESLPKRLQMANSILKAAVNESAVSGRLVSTADLKAVWVKANLEAIQLIEDSTASDADRITALNFLGRTPLSDKNMLISMAKLISPQVARPVQLAAIEAVGRRNSKLAPRLLLDNWRSQSPSVRNKIVDVMLSQADWTLQLLDAIAMRSVGVREISSVHRQRLVSSPNKATQQRAVALLAETQPRERESVLTAYREALTKQGDVNRGRAVFTKTCSACHRLDGIGKSVGADLATLKDRSRNALLVAILDPNRAVESKFVTYTAIDSKGRNHSGLLANESGTALVLQGADGKRTTLLRRDLDDLISSTISFMPEGLEKELSVQAVADVMAFVQSAGKPPKTFPGQTPRTINQTADGLIELPANAARIFGPSIVFEQKYKNLGFWQNIDDFATWNFTVNKPGEFIVEFDYAVESSTANGTIKVAIGEKSITSQVPSTGTWDTYKTWRLGTLAIPAGNASITISAPVKPAGALIDLRTVRLISGPK